MNNSDIKDTIFREAVEAIDTGNIALLEQLINGHPRLITEKLNHPKEGYFNNPYLLWFIADNPIRHDKLPENIVAVTKLLINAVKKTSPETYQHQIEYTLGLVTTGRIPHESGKQIELIDLLIDAGAPPGKGHGALAHGNFDAARRLIERGGELTLVAAICLCLPNNIEILAKNASPSDLQTSLIAAAFYGKADMIKFLIELGADVNAFADPGFHSHATALHQAVYSGSLDTVKILVDAGAGLDIKDKVYESTPSGWAKHMRTVTGDDEMRKKYKEIETYLLGKEK